MEKAIPLDKFIEHSLYDKKKGYYINKNPIGENGDFITSPQISVHFSEMIAIWLVGFWEKLGKPKNLNVIELGAGTGEMMYQINKSISSFKQFKQSCNFYILEISPELIKIQKKKNSLFKIKWIDNLNEIKKNPSIFLANEFFDSLPVKHFIRENNEWFEKYITKKKDKYFFKNKKKKIVEIEKILGEKIKKNQNFIEVSPKSIAKISKISSIIKKNNGGVLINPTTGNTRFELTKIDPVLYTQIQRLNDNEISAPLLEQDNVGSSSYKIIKVTNRYDEHVADYSKDFIKIKELALKEKQLKTIQNWMSEKIIETYISVNKDSRECNFANKWLKK